MHRAGTDGAGIANMIKALGVLTLLRRHRTDDCAKASRSSASRHQGFGFVVDGVASGSVKAIASSVGLVLA